MITERIFLALLKIVETSCYTRRIALITVLKCVRFPTEKKPTVLTKFKYKGDLLI